ncbi:type I restriction endonuclease subunit R, partial [Salmonella enterica subsp. enterica]|nr:type I restriction endonuclease subunit R [Salmonella enterica subsp. enterica]
QAFSRTNRIYDATKTFGNIVTFRNLEQATIDAITLFGDKNTKNVVLEKSYEEYMNGFTDIATGEARRGFMDVLKTLERCFPDTGRIETEKDKKAFVRLFGEYLRAENILQNYDEFTTLRALRKVDLSDPVATETFKAEHYLDDGELTRLKAVRLPSERKVQDYRSTY